MRHGRLWTAFLSLSLFLFGPSLSAQPWAPAPPDDIHLCFAEGTDPALVAHHEARNGLKAAPLDLPFGHDFFETYSSGRWTDTATDGSGLDLGDPTTLTWSIVPDGTSIYGYKSSEGEVTSGSDLRAFLNGIYGSESVWLPLFQQAFDRWGELIGVTYVYVEDDGAAFEQSYRPPGELGVRGDVRIAGHAVDNESGGILAYNFGPASGGDMVIDTTPSTTYSNTDDNSLRLRNILTHEHGHGLGLAHSCPGDKTKLMEPYLRTVFDGPQHDDILGANRMYGDALEPNDAPGMAYVFDDFGPWSGVTVSDVSIDDVSDVDYYEFTVPLGSAISIELSPVGETYLAGAQNSNGSCSAGTSYNSLDNQDLALALLDSNGLTVLAAADDTGAGGSEGLDITLSGAGPYYIEVSGSSDEAQMYELSLSLDWTDGLSGVLDYGNVSVDERFVTMSSANFVTPRIFTGPPTKDGDDPITSRVEAFSDGTWDWHLQEWDYLDGAHQLETAGYLIVRDGVQSLGGLDAEAGSVTVDDNWMSVTFGQSFSSTPVVLAQVASYSGTQAVTPRLRNVSTTGFEIFLQEEEANDGIHADERVDWLAIETGTTTFDGKRIIVGRTGDNVTESWHGEMYREVFFQSPVGDPTLLAQIQTFDGTDPASLRMRNLGPWTFEIKIQEETSLDSETNHNSENVGYVVIGDK